MAVGIDVDGNFSEVRSYFSSTRFAARTSACKGARICRRGRSRACARGGRSGPGGLRRFAGGQLRLLQLRVLRFGLLQDGDVGVGIFPEREEIFVGGECADAGGIGICALRRLGLQGVGTSYSQMRQRSRPAVPDDAAVVENLLKLGGGSTPCPAAKYASPRMYT